MAENNGCFLFAFSVDEKMTRGKKNPSREDARAALPKPHKLRLAVTVSVEVPPMASRATLGTFFVGYPTTSIVQANACALLVAEQQ